MDKALVPLSKFLSLILRHDPGAAGIALDSEGWAEIEAILAQQVQPITRDEIDRIVATNPKQRFALSPDGTRIRARQGHSLAVDLGLAPVTPPQWLYHGTARNDLDAIRAEGLKPGARQHVHLSPDPEIAHAVGARHGAPVVLIVAAGALAAAGHLFYLSENGVWLTDRVPPGYITAPET